MGCEEDIQRQINLAYTRNWQYSVFILIEFYSCFIIILFDIFIFMLILFSNQEKLVKKKRRKLLNAVKYTLSGWGKRESVWEWQLFGLY